MKRVEDELNDILSRDCKKFIDEIRGTKSLLYRGTMKFVNDYAIFNSRIDDKGLSNIIAGSIINVIVKDLPFDEWWKTKYSNVYLPEMIVNLYRKEGLEEAILSGNEISFKCDRYFMINLKYDELILEILNE